MARETVRTYDSQCSVTLALADGSRWTIRATDEQSRLAVSRMGMIMRLRPGTGGREIYAVVCRDRMHDEQTPSRDGAVVCWLLPRIDPFLQVIQMERIAALIALQLLPRGGLLLHGALAEYKGAGYLMAGPSGVGKSTSSRRLPPPHRSLSDDRTLVVRDRVGRYWAHPWPTWSRFLNGDTDCSWPVEEAVPLRGIFFLRQSASERLQPTGRTQAAAKLMESAIDLVRGIARQYEAGESLGLWQKHLTAAKTLAATVPAYSLEVSLHGEFWKEIEQVLSVAGDHGASPPLSPEGQGSPDLLRADTDTRDSESPRPEACDGKLRYVCLGNAMAPTLTEGDILEVEPCDRRRVGPGDVVCFKSPENGETCVRRVASVERQRTKDEGPRDVILTRGDNCETNDPWLLRAEDITGRVVAARSGSRRRPVSGGVPGRATVVLLDGLRPLWALGRRLHLRLRDLAAGVGPVGWIVPRHPRFRVLEFNGRHCADVKLFFGKLEVGRYGSFPEAWRIRRLFRPLVDVSRLPAPPRWSLPSFVRASSPLLHPGQTSATPAAPKKVAPTGRGDSESRELPDLPSSTPLLTDVHSDTLTTVYE
jgi:hypothetical protein